MRVESGAPRPLRRAMRAESPPEKGVRRVTSEERQDRSKGFARPATRDFFFIAEQLARAPHLAHPEGFAAPRIVQVTEPHVSYSGEHFPN